MSPIFAGRPANYYSERAVVAQRALRALAVAWGRPHWRASLRVIPSHRVDPVRKLAVAVVLERGRTEPIYFGYVSSRRCLIRSPNVSAAVAKHTGGAIGQG